MHEVIHAVFVFKILLEKHPKMHLTKYTKIVKTVVTITTRNAMTSRRKY
jgi:hypothetical protein